jgi:hypothetical protein
MHEFCMHQMLVLNRCIHPATILNILLIVNTIATVQITMSKQPTDPAVRRQFFIENLKMHSLLAFRV